MATRMFQARRKEVSDSENEKMRKDRTKMLFWPIKRWVSLQLREPKDELSSLPTNSQAEHDQESQIVREAKQLMFTEGLLWVRQSA